MDPADLALVIDDPLAPRVLAWWEKAKPDPNNVDHDALCRLVFASRLQAEATLERCRLAGLLLDGGIAPVARKWLGAYVAEQIGAKPAPPPKKRERGAVMVATAIAIAIAASVALTLPVVRAARVLDPVTQRGA